MSEVTVSLGNGKYTFFKDEKGILQCHRYGEAWREFLGDKAVTALFDHAVALGGVEHERPYREAANPNATLDLNLIHEVLQSCQVALPVLRNLCRHAGLNAGVTTTEQIMAELAKAIAEAERFAKEVRR